MKDETRKTDAGKTEYKKRIGEVKVRQNVEWGRLRTAFVGSAENIILPPITKSNEAAYTATPVLGGILNKYASQGSVVLKDVWPEQYDKILKTHEELFATMGKLGVELHKLKHNVTFENYYGYQDGGYWPPTPEDSYKVIGDTLLETSFSATVPATAVLTFGHRDVVAEFLKQDKGFNWLCVPPCYPEHPDVGQGPGPFVSAAEMRVLPNKKVIIGMGVHDESDMGKPGYEYSAVNHLGVEILNRMFEPYGWTFEPYYYVTKYCHHSNGCLSPVREGLVIVAPDVVPRGLPNAMKDWEVINLTHEEALLGAANLCPIDSKNSIISAGCPKLSEELSKRGVEPHPVDFEGTMMVTAGAQCNVIAINRDDV